MKQNFISAVVLTKNDETRIANCIRSLNWCDEVIIIDDYSEDETLSAKSYSRNLRRLIPGISRLPLNIKTYKRRLDGDFGAQRNYGLEKTRGEWVLFVDSDEVITKELQQEIITKIKQSESVGFYLKRKDYFLGRWLQFGETNNVKFLRLGKKKGGKWQGRVHEVWKIEGEVRELENPILHYPHESISQFFRKINHYTDLVAQCWKEEGRVTASGEILLYPFGKFIQNYILRLGFLDGIQGLILALMMSFHSFLARSKYWLLTHT